VIDQRVIAIRHLPVISRDSRHEQVIIPDAVIHEITVEDQDRQMHTFDIDFWDIEVVAPRSDFGHRVDCKCDCFTRR
jgi:hypothetical protein